MRNILLSSSIVFFFCLHSTAQVRNSPKIHQKIDHVIKKKNGSGVLRVANHSFTPSNTDYYNWEEADYVYDFSARTEYTASGKKSVEVFYNSETGDSTFRDVFIYDSADSLVALIWLEWNDQLTKWDSTYKYTTVYDQYGNLIEEFNLFFDTEKSEWEFTENNTSYKYTYTYDDQNRILVKTTYELYPPDDTEWKLSGRITNYYGEDPFRFLYITESYNNNQWTLSRKDSGTFTPLDNYITNYNFFYNSTLNRWDTTAYTHHYYQDLQEIEHIDSSRHFRDGVFYLNYINTVTYDNFGTRTAIGQLDFEDDGEYLNDQMFKWFYDNHGHITRSEEYLWNEEENDWDMIYFEGTEKFYGTEGQLLYEILEEGDASEVDKVKKAYMDEVLSLDKNAGYLLDYLLFPNPANNLITIKGEGLSGLTARLNDSFGNTIFETTLNQTAHKIDVSTIEPGVYFLSIISKGGSGIKKIIKN